MDPTAATERDLSKAELERRAEDLLDRPYRARGSAGQRKQDVARRVVSLVENAQEATERTQGLAALARSILASAEGDLEGADARAREALAAFEREPYMPWLVRVLQALGTLAGRRGRLAEAEAHFERGLAAAREHGVAEFEPNFLSNLGLVHARNGDLARGLERYQQARQLFRRLGMPAGEGAVLVHAGPVHRMLGAYPEALGALVEGLELLEREGEPPPLVTGLANLADLYALLGIPDQALKYALEARDRAPADTPPAAQAWCVLARAHRAAGEVAAARDAAERSIAVAQHIGQPFLGLDPLIELAELDLEAGRLDEAEDRYREGLAVAASMDVPDMELTLQLGMAGVLEARGDLEAAHALATSQVAIAEEFGERHTLIELYEMLGRLSEARGDLGTALAHLKRVQELRADLFSRETDIRVRNIQVAHELRREQQDSARVLQELSRRVMNSQEEERRRVATELHDGLGQRVALLAVEIDMLAQSPPTSAEETSSSLELLAEQAHTIAEEVRTISHHLHPAPLAQLGLVRATRSLCEELARLHEIEIDFVAEVSRRVPDDVSLCLYRIVQSGLSNSVRHGQAPRARVQLDEEDDAIRLRLADEGIGFDPAHLGGSGIGIAGMRERAGHLGGRFTLESRPGQGTRILVVLPLTAEDPEADA